MYVHRVEYRMLNLLGRGEKKGGRREGRREGGGGKGGRREGGGGKGEREGGRRGEKGGRRGGGGREEGGNSDPSCHTFLKHGFLWCLGEAPNKIFYIL